MPYTALSDVQHRIRVGQALPFNVHAADGTLLLARAQRVEGAAQLAALIERGALVDTAELPNLAESVKHAPREQLPLLWRQCMDRVGTALQHAPHRGFGGALGDAVQPVQAMIDRDPDLAIFQILRQAPGSDADYGARRSLNAGVTAYLVAQRLGWQPEEMERALKVALTMNISMLTLQGELARMAASPSDAQRAQLQSHPLRSMEMLAAFGIEDRDWLQAVARHHELEDGSGYPSGCTDVGELASLARRADLYTSKLASRSHRTALSADVAGRQMFMEDPGHPMTAALVREFGIYPPGCLVRLSSGETGIVVKRGPTVTTPVVACLTNERGAPVSTSYHIDTADRAHRIEAIVGERSINVRLTAEKLMALTLL